MAPKEDRRTRRLTALALALAAVLSLPVAGYDVRPGAPTVEAAGLVWGVLASTPVVGYQGRLVDPATGNPKANGSYLMTFSLYAVESLGSPLWTENKNVSVNGGVFSTLLGDTTPLNLAVFDGRALWLGVTVGADAEVAPRVPIAYTPYALHANHAGNADTLDGSHASAFAGASHTHDAAAISSGTLSTDRYSALADLGAEGHLGNAAGDLAQNNGTLQPTLNADLLDGSHASAFAVAGHTHDAAAIVSGVLSTDRYSALADLGAENHLGNAAGDLAQNNGVLQRNLNADLLDGYHANVLANVKFFTLEPYAAFFGNGTSYSDGWGPYAGVHLPRNGSTPDFAYGFTIPPDYSTGGELVVRLLWHTPSVNCTIQLVGNFISVARAGRTHIAGISTTDGLILVGGAALNAPGTANVSSEKFVKIVSPDERTKLQALDSIIFGLFRDARTAADSCSGDLVIQSISVAYQ